MPTITDVAEIADEINRRLMSVPITKIPNITRGYKRPAARMVCADGFSVSVQGHYGAYCVPRDNEGPWIAVECGYPSAPMPTLADRCEDSDRAETATETVWAYVPMERIAEVLASHGGLIGEWTP